MYRGRFTSKNTGYGSSSPEGGDDHIRREKRRNKVLGIFAGSVLTAALVGGGGLVFIDHLRAGVRKVLDPKVALMQKDAQATILAIDKLQALQRTVKSNPALKYSTNTIRREDQLDRTVDNDYATDQKAYRSFVSASHQEVSEPLSLFSDDIFNHADRAVVRAMNRIPGAHVELRLSD